MSLEVKSLKIYEMARQRAIAIEEQTDKICLKMVATETLKRLRDRIDTELKRRQYV